MAEDQVYHWQGTAFKIKCTLDDHHWQYMQPHDPQKYPAQFILLRRSFLSAYGYANVALCYWSQ